MLHNANKTYAVKWRQKIYSCDHLSVYFGIYTESINLKGGFMKKVSIINYFIYLFILYI